MDRYTHAPEGERHQLVKEDLRRLGYQPGSTDARWDPAATRALAAYQADKGIPPTGRHAPAVFAIMRSDVAESRSTK